MEPLRLHYAPDNASLCVRLALEALEMPYQTALVDRRAGGHKAPTYLAMNPNGLIPVLETPEGAMFETGAILLWLSDQANGKLMPAPGARGRAHGLQWLFWLANTLHPALRIMFYPDQHIDAAPDALLAKTKQRIAAMLDVLETGQNMAWCDTAEPSLHGCYLAPMLRWAQIYGAPDSRVTLQRWPRLMAFAQAADDWPCAKKVATAEGLGATPFSNPSPARPPEGAPL